MRSSLTNRTSHLAHRKKMPARFFVVIAYDIRDDRRRLRVAEELKNFGYRVQYSVFEAVLDRVEIETMQEALAGWINPEEDSIRIYVLTERSKREILTLGVQREWQDPEIWVF